MSLTKEIETRQDSALSARIVRSTPLIYESEAEPGSDRPPHVRAASSLVHVTDVLVAIQDDANFLALVDRDRNRVRYLTLPAGPDGQRVFDEERGNKHQKHDLEACLAVPNTDGDFLIAFGSGSLPNSGWILSVDWRKGDEPNISLLDASAFYEALRQEHAFSGSGLNIEGAIFVGDDTIRLFQRGNSEAQGNLQPVDATGDLSWSALEAHLQNPDAVSPPQLSNIMQYQLGHLDGVRLTFSDAEPVGESILFSASAEASDESERIAGSVLGIIDGRETRWVEMINEDGTAFGGKVEGLSLAPNNPYHAYFVIDDDDAEKPSEIFEVELSGPWYQNNA
ncbi:MAG: hypothetical protein BRC42_03550 [Cyanobacteria bacterium QS_1_48_34]|jgi:hypothetical protein|nr:MAG: hypothetical protein BRC42_03550 [Cyanobacteria bacterium QS_1_48_34]